jgi:hypothetical protein
MKYFDVWPARPLAFRLAGHQIGGQNVAVYCSLNDGDPSNRVLTYLFRVHTSGLQPLVTVLWVLAVASRAQSLREGNGCCEGCYKE